LPLVGFETCLAGALKLSDSVTNRSISHRPAGPAEYRSCEWTTWYILHHAIREGSIARAFQLRCRHERSAPAFRPIQFRPAEIRKSFASASREIDLVERGPQSCRQFQFIVCPEAHEEQTRLVIEHVNVQGRDLDAIVAQIRSTD